MTLKRHLAVSSRNVFGGHNTTTLCGRENARRDSDGAPDASADVASDVTCSHCLKILARPTHWRYRKYLRGNQA